MDRGLWLWSRGICYSCLTVNAKLRTPSTKFCTLSNTTSLHNSWISERIEITFRNLSFFLFPFPAPTNQDACKYNFSIFSIYICFQMKPWIPSKASTSLLISLAKKVITKISFPKPFKWHQKRFIHVDRLCNFELSDILLTFPSHGIMDFRRKFSDYVNTKSEYTNSVFLSPSSVQNQLPSKVQF